MKTRPGQFKAFIDKLIYGPNTPEDYRPWLFKVQKESKAPETSEGISWKSPPWEFKGCNLTPAQSLKRLKQGEGNIGIAGRKYDQLILVDIDDPSIEHQLKPTLKIRSRSRTGTHAFYWADPEDERLPMNIPTDKGEIRSSDQYVVAPGSYVPCTEEELEEKVESGELNKEQKERVLDDPYRGFYTLDNDKEISTITFEELPKVFREQALQAEKEREKREEERENYNPEPIEGNNQHSALFDLTVSDLTGRGFGKRDSHPLHISRTEANWIIEGELGHCWRHLVSLNAIQFLCVEAGLYPCEEVGTPHHNSQNGPSTVWNNDKAIWTAWKHAKEHGYIPEDDPIPVRAMWHIVREHNIGNPKHWPEEGESKVLPRKLYNQAIRTIEEKY